MMLYSYTSGLLQPYPTSAQRGLRSAHVYLSFPEARGSRGHTQTSISIRDA